jgi:hypothetical protein
LPIPLSKATPPKQLSSPTSLSQSLIASLSLSPFLTDPSLHDTDDDDAIHIHTHNTFAVIRAIDNTDIDYIDTYIKSQATHLIASHRCRYRIAAAIIID